jgi:hypothetical protein
MKKMWPAHHELESELPEQSLLIYGQKVKR